MSIHSPMREALFVLLLAQCVPLFAQGHEDTGDALDTILVTASRSPLARVNVGSSTTVISRMDIERQQARYVTDLLRKVPGFSVSQAGTFGSQTQVRVRGAEANHVLVLIDGVRANDPASDDDFRWEYLSTSNVERIEIVRGPQSSLWGSDAVSAVVNVITRSGKDRNDMGLYIEGGSFNTFNGGLQGGTGSDDWSLGFGLERLDTDGSNVSRGGDEDDGSDMTTASFSGDYRPTENLLFNAGVRIVDARSQYDPTDFFISGLPVDGDIATDTRQTYAQFGAGLNTLDARVFNQLNFRYLETNNRSLTDGVEDSSTGSDRVTVSWQSDIRLAENMLSLAVEHERTRFQQRGEVSFGDPNQDQEFGVNSAIADFQGKSFGPLSWLLSARYDDNSDFDKAFTGRFALAYELSEATRLRTSIGTGQKAPTFIERFGFFPGQFVGNPDLKPETSVAYEVGIDQSFLSDELSLQLTLFRQDLKDEIDGFAFDPDTFLFTARNKPGRSSRDGVEFAAFSRPAESLEFSVAYTYTDSTEEDAAGQHVQELRRPRHSGSLTANYRFADDRANVLLYADYGGERDDIFFPPFPEPSQVVTLGSYWLLGLTAAFDVSKNVNVFARLTNVLDENYEQVYGYNTPGRAAYLGMRLNFGR